MEGEVLPLLAQVTRLEIIEAAYFFVALYLSISAHEASHAWMAYRCGDDTARLMGRMTLNPIVHIDPVGTVLLPALMVLMPLFTHGGGLGLPLFGWAKPVPVNPLRFRDMRKGEILVSLAGPVSNFVLAVGSLVACWLVIAAFGFQDPNAPGHIGAMLLLFFESLLSLNVLLGLFNLIPIPPLDGSHILGAFLTAESARKVERLLMPPFNIIVLLFVAVPLVRVVFLPVHAALEYLILIWWR